MAAALAALLLADGRTPVGGHAHSGGIESAVADGRVADVAGLERYLEARVRTAGLVDAALAAATVTGLATPASSSDAAKKVLAGLDAEADARLLAPPLRAASRRLGRQLVRVAARCWPAVVLAEVAGLHDDGPHQAVATGAVAVAAGLDAAATTDLVVHHVLATPAQAAVKLLGLDPFEVTAVLARLASVAAAVAAEALTAAAGPWPDLPALTSPLVEVAAVEHQAWPVRMFAT